MGLPELRQLDRPEPTNEWTRIKESRVDEDLMTSKSEAENLAINLGLIPKGLTFAWDFQKRLVVGKDNSWDYNWHQASIELIGPGKTGCVIRISLTANSVTHIRPNTAAVDAEFLNQDSLSQSIHVTNSGQVNSHLLNSKTVQEAIENMNHFTNGFDEPGEVVSMIVNQTQCLKKPENTSRMLFYSASNEWAGEGITVFSWGNGIEMSYHTGSVGEESKDKIFIRDGEIIKNAGWVLRRFPGLDLAALAKFKETNFYTVLKYMANNGFTLGDRVKFWNQFSKEAPGL